MTKKEKLFKTIEDRMLLSLVWSGWMPSVDGGDMYYFEKKIDGHVGSMYAENCYGLLVLPDQSGPLLDRLYENYTDFDSLFDIDGEVAGKCQDKEVYKAFLDDLKESLDYAKETREDALSCFSPKDREYLASFVKESQDVEDQLCALKDDPDFIKKYVIYPGED